MFQQLYAAYQKTGDTIYRSAGEEIVRLRKENERLVKRLIIVNTHSAQSIAQIERLREMIDATREILRETE
jgi:chaperonin cofactor prefoldin